VASSWFDCCDCYGTTFMMKASYPPLLVSVDPLKLPPLVAPTTIELPLPSTQTEMPQSVAVPAELDGGKVAAVGSRVLGQETVAGAGAWNNKIPTAEIALLPELACHHHVTGRIKRRADRTGRRGAKRVVNTADQGFGPDGGAVG